MKSCNGYNGHITSYTVVRTVSQLAQEEIHIVEGGFLKVHVELFTCV
jgi:hypothetical protein